MLHTFKKPTLHPRSYLDVGCKFKGYQKPKCEAGFSIKHGSATSGFWCCYDKSTMGCESSASQAPCYYHDECRMNIEVDPEEFLRVAKKAVDRWHAKRVAQ